MMLPDHEIREIALAGAIKPFRHEQLQPASYDVRLGNVFRVAVPHGTRFIDLEDPSTFANLTKRVGVPEGSSFTIHPGDTILAHTEEVVHVPHGIVGRVEGKSSLGRLFLIIHMAGFVDPGFHGVVTLELVNFNKVPIVLRPGNLIAQLSFAHMSSESLHPYEGRYQGDREATESKYGK